MNKKNTYSKLRIVLCLLALGIFTTTGFWLFQELNANTEQVTAYQFDENTNPEKLKGKEKYAYYQYLYNKYNGMSKAEIKKMPKQDRPDLAMLQDYLRTADPRTGEIPENARIKANELTDIRLNALTANQRAIAGVNWIERGPNNVGGRTRAVMFDPNDATNKKVWAGGVGGGLWSTNDITVANPTWVAVDNFWENIAISTIAYDPSNTQTFYVGTGEGFFGGGMQRGAGMWKTTDGGATWNRLVSTSPTTTDDFQYIQKLAVTASGTVLAVCRTDGFNSTDPNSGGVFRSTDGGTSWTKVTLPETSTRGADLEIATDGTIYATTGLFGAQVGSIYKSTSASDGVVWTEVTPAGISGNTRRIEVASAPSNSDILYAVGHDNSNSNIAFFKKSIDAGATWTDVTVPKYLNQNCTVSTTDFTRGQAWYDLILKVNPTDPDHVVVGGIDVHRSTDGGANWTSISYWTGGCGQYVHADIHEFAYRPGSSDEMLVGSDGGIAHTTNLRATTPTFNDKNSGYNVTQFYSTAMHPTATSSYALAGAQDNGTQQFTNAGLGATVQATGGDGGFCYIDQDNPNIQITAFTNNNINVSTNGGTSFGTLGSRSNDGGFINPGDYHDPLDLLYTASTAGGNVARWTVPAGARTNMTVSTVSGTVTHMKASPFSPAGTTTLYVGTSSGQVVRAPDAHTGAAPVGTDIANATMNSQGSVSSVEFGSTENQIVVTYSNYGSQNVWYTNDGGTTWTSKDSGHGLPDMPVRWAMFNPNNTNEVLIATETGVWSTDDITAAPAADFWELTSTGLANTRCDMFQIRDSDKVVAVATHGRGLFTTGAFAAPAASFGVDKEFVYEGSDVIFTDFSFQATSWDWDFGVGATPATSTAQGPHTVTYNTPGVKTITLTINGGGSAALTASRTITVMPNRPAPYALTDGGNFEVNPADFTAENVSGGTAWERGNSAIAGKDGVVSGANAWVTGLTEAVHSSNGHANLYTPNFDFSTAGIYTLSFQTKHAFEDGWDGMIVEFSTDKGTSWSKLGATTTGTSWYNADTDGNTGFGGAGTTFMSGALTNYTTKTLDVSNLAGNADVAFRVVFRSDTNTEEAGAAIDDFTISFTTPVATNLSVSTNTASEAATTAVTVTATAAAAVTGDQTVNLAASGTGITTGDYTLNSSTITILDGQTTGTATFTIVDDVLIEGTETATLTISSPSAGLILGTTTTQDVTITDNDFAPTITLGTINPTTYCAGSTISIPFTQTGTYAAGNTFTAQLSDATGNFTTPTATQVGTTPISLVIPNTLATGAGYKVRVVASDPVTTSNSSADITINTLPTDITTVANPASILSGESSDIEVPLSQVGVSYQLQDLGNNDIGTPVVGTGATITLNTGNLTTTTVFKVVATNTTTTCSRTLSNVTVTIPGSGGSPPVTVGVPTRFVATGVSTSQIDLTWDAVGNATGYLLFEGNTLVSEITSGATTTYEHTGLEADSYHAYRLFALNGSVRSPRASQANDATFPNAPIVVSTTPSCGTGSAGIVLSGSGAVFNVYTTETGGTMVDQTDDNNYETLTISENTTYYISMIGVYGKESQTRTRVDVVVNTPFAATITEGSSVRSCDASATLTANEVAGATYVWLKNGAEITDSNSSSYTVTSSGSYEVRISRETCVTTSSRSRVILNYAPIAEIVNGTLVRFCDNGIIRAKEAANATYSWTLDNVVVGTEQEVSVSESGQYTLTVTEEGCTATDVIDVEVTSLAPVSFTASDSVFCSGDQVTLTADLVNGVTYNWSRDGRVFRSNVGNTVTVSSTGDYSVTVSQNGCTSPASASVSIERLNVETTYLRTTETTLFLEPANESTVITNVVWFFNNEESGLSGETITPTEDGNYSAIVTYSTGCTFQTRTVSFSLPVVVVGEEEEFIKTLRIYPNPSNGTFLIELGEVKDAVAITVVDALGRVVKTDVIPANASSYNLNLARFASGAYTIQLKTDKGVIIKKLMKE
ncbi:T9SS type A sorting domain-containing protein [Bernardetia sp. ABR2-2B]|uniref:T9SS type A sorting domain-containing protein n=1 Tax=Bernardetia sp. ABR2-2B TaxID=3127472 RepID=UPI0030D1D60A